MVAVSSDQTEIDQLLKEVQTIKESYDRVAQATGEDFNIFSVLQVETDEENTHSRFIAELLDPNGSHGQGTVFLQKFLDKIGIENFQASNAKVDTERFVKQSQVAGGSDGRVDIFIASGDSEPKNEIIIENKIGANLGEQQLEKYQRASPSSTLVYLSLFGEAPDIGIDYRSMSYEKDILEWLKACRKEAVDLPVLRESLTQYINLVKKLTNQNIKQQMSNDIVNRVLRDPSSLEAYTSLIQSKKEVIKAIIDQKIPPIMDRVQRKHNLVLQNSLEPFKNNERFSGFTFLNDELKAVNLNIRFEVQANDRKNLIFGFTYLDKDYKDRYSYERIKDQFKEVFNGKRETGGWPCFKFYTDFEDWSNLNTLKKVKFTEEFEQDFEAKISSMMEIVKDNLPA